MSEQEKYQFELHEPRKNPRNWGLEKVNVFPEQVKEWFEDCLRKQDYKGIIDLKHMGLDWDELCRNEEIQGVVLETIKILEESVGSQKDETVHRKMESAITELKTLRNDYFPRNYV